LGPFDPLVAVAVLDCICGGGVCLYVENWLLCMMLVHRLVDCGYCLSAESDGALVKEYREA